MTLALTEWESELKAEQREWAVLDNLDISHWTETMTWEEMQEDRFRQMGYVQVKRMGEVIFVKKQGA